MAQSRKQPAPEGLQDAGAALWLKITGMRGPDGKSLILSAQELLILQMACRQADDLAALERQLRSDGIVTVGSKGQPRLSALPTEIRLQRAALAKLLTQLALPEVGEDEGLTPAQRKALRAAQSRWVREQKRRQQHREAASG